MFLNLPLREHEKKWLESYRHYENSLQHESSIFALVKNRSLSKDLGINKKLSNRDVGKMTQTADDIRKYFGTYLHTNSLATSPTLQSIPLNSVARVLVVTVISAPVQHLQSQCACAHCHVRVHVRLCVCLQWLCMCLRVCL